jgi:hypothetical protein
MKSITDGEIADKIRLAISRETATHERYAEGR